MNVASTVAEVASLTEYRIPTKWALSLSPVRLPLTPVALLIKFYVVILENVAFFTVYSL